VKEVKDTGVKVPHELVGKGGYGCVYKPNISCSGSLNPEGNYISKIQMSNEVSKNINKETQYGKIVQSFPDYRLYFAPVIESCPININVLSEEELSKCDIFQQPTAEMMGTMDAKVGETNAKVGATYVSSKIPFIEGKNMSVYFKAREQFESPFFPSNVSRSFYHLLKAIRILQSGTDDSIVHFDLKDGNIIFDEIHGNPVIIDFGLSFTKSTLMDNLNDTHKLAEVFYAYSPYEPWCIEIHLLSYIVQNILLKLDEEGNRGEKITAPITEEEIKELKDVCQKFVDDLAKKNVGGNNDYIPDIQQLNSYLDSFIVGKDIWKELVEDLAKHYLSWDVYSIAICYLKYINDWNIGLLDGILRDVVAFVPVKGSEGRRRKSVDEIIGLL
jgi:serine/threonine protein kinase